MVLAEQAQMWILPSFCSTFLTCPTAITTSMRLTNCLWSTTLFIYSNHAVKLFLQKHKPEFARVLPLKPTCDVHIKRLVLFYFLNRSSDNHRLSNLFVGCPHMEIFGTIIWWRRWSRRYTRFAVRQGMPQCSAIRVCAPVRFEIYVCDVTSRTTTREAAASSPYIQVVYWWLRARAVAFTSNRLYGRAGAHILRQQFRA